MVLEPWEGGGCGGERTKTDMMIEGVVALTLLVPLTDNRNDPTDADEEALMVRFNSTEPPVT